MNTETPPTIQEEELHEAPASSDFGYTDEELEEERTSLCISQGISRFC